jgi:hypothetical protein
VREIAPYVLKHRLIVSDGTTADDVLEAALDVAPQRVLTAVPAAG